MTYNFDPDRWYAIESRMLERKHQQGIMDEEGYEAALEELDRRYDQMVERLDGTYRIP